MGVDDERISLNASPVQYRPRFGQDKYNDILYIQWGGAARRPVDCNLFGRTIISPDAIDAVPPVVTNDEATYLIGPGWRDTCACRLADFPAPDHP